MNFESFLTSESPKIERQQVLEALLAHGKSQAGLEMLSAWISQEQERVRTIENKTEEVYAAIAFDIQKIELYIETGFYEEALLELEGDEYQSGLIEVQNFPDLHEKVKALIEKIKSRIV